MAENALAKLVDKAYADKTAAELVDAPVDALKGVSEADGEALKKALNIKTIGDLAHNKFFVAARIIADLAAHK
jgi:hypothetical protein